MQFVRRCYGLRGIYGRFDSKIRFEIESDGRFDSRFDSNAKKRFAGPYVKRQLAVASSKEMGLCYGVTNWLRK